MKDVHMSPASSGELPDTQSRMDPELKAKWVAALRSGEYEQTQDGYLCLLIDATQTFRYCCLGVLRAVANPSDEEQDVDSELLHAGQLTRFQLDGAQQSLLAKMNDGGKTFPEIADWIEANL